VSDNDIEEVEKIVEEAGSISTNSDEDLDISIQELRQNYALCQIA
jgi:hypothetical protein